MPPIRRLLFAGEAIVDIAMRVPAFPQSGAQSGVLADSSRITVGGGFNVMAAAARQGLPVLYAGGHGTGPWGDLVRKALSAEGIEVLRAPDPLRDTGFAVALTRVASGDTPGERAYVTQLGAESVRPPGCMDEVPVMPGDAVYISGYGLIPAGSGPVQGEWVLGEWAASLPPGALLFLDPGHLAARIPDSLLDRVLSRCDWLSLTAAEAGVLTGAGTPEAAARALLSRTRNVIVRLGPSGCLLCLQEARVPEAGASKASVPGHADVPEAARVPGAAGVSGAVATGFVHIPAPAVTPVDTTGAGDAHAGAFLAALAGGLPPEPAARRANAAAALSITRPGPATAPTRPELNSWLP